MSTPITFNGVAYSVPAYNDSGYAQGAGNLSAYLIAIASGTLQKTGGIFALTADANFGNSFGLISLYYKSTTANVATAGQIRLARIDTIDWRNQANAANLALGVNSTDQLTYNGVPILTSAGGAFVSAIVGTTNQVLANGTSGTPQTGVVTLTTPQDIGTTSTPTFGRLHLTSTTTPQLDIIAAGVNPAQILLRGNSVTNVITSGSDGNLTLVDSDNSRTYFNYIRSANTLNLTAGDILLSPALKVPSGGTGNTTFTAYSVICAGTTATGAFQNVSGVGTSGQVLTSNGAATLPTWQNVAGTGTVNSGTATHIAYYATSTNAVSDANGATLSGGYIWSGANTWNATGTFTSNVEIQNTLNLTTISSNQIAFVPGANTVFITVPNPAATRTYTLGDAGANASFVMTEGNQSINGTKAFSGDVQVSRSNSGNNTAVGVSNTSNTASSDATLQATVAGTSAGDPYIELIITGGSNWSAGIDNSDSDQYKISQSTSLGINDALVISTSGPAVSIHGSITNDSAAAGFVGQYISASQSTFTNFPATGTYGDLVSISLTAGDWDVSLQAMARLNGATMTTFSVGISTTTGNSSAGLVEGDNLAQTLPPTSTSTSSAAITSYRISLNATTTIYYKYSATYTAGNPQLTGRISTRRVR